MLPSVELLGLILHDVAKSIKAFGTKIPSIKILTRSQLRKLHFVGPLATPYRLDLSERPDHLYFAHYDCGTESNCLTVGQDNSHFPRQNIEMLDLHYDDIRRWYQRKQYSTLPEQYCFVTRSRCFGCAVFFWCHPDFVDKQYTWRFLRRVVNMTVKHSH